MGGVCSCFGESQSDLIVAEGSREIKNKSLHNVVKKFKSIFHKSQVENAATNEGSRNEARVAAAEPPRTNSTATPGAISMQCVVQPQQSNPVVNISNSTSSQPSGQQNQNMSKPGTAQSGNTVGQKRYHRLKRDAKDTVQEKAKQLVEPSSGEFKDCDELLPSSDEEDVCPTCLEEYDEDNPKITSECNHHFHLSCIYEWRERSTLCPVCNKAMVFEQMT